MNDKYKSAFPVHPEVSVVNDPQWCGMTLRDYFAAKAMQGFASNLGPGATFNSRAETAYEWADAMLKARKQ